MKRYLIKKAAFKKEFKSKWNWWVLYPEDSHMIVEDPSYNKDYFDEAKEFAESEFADFKKSIMSTLDSYHLDNVISDIEFTLTSSTAVMTVTYNEEATDEILFRTAEWIEAQYADGFGEGLEQTPCCDFETEVEVEYEDEEGEIQYDTETDIGTLYVKLWKAGDFNLSY